MASFEPFDAQAATRRLQAAIKTHDQAGLDALVSDRMLFTSGRPMGRIGREGFIEAALTIEWISFLVSDVRALDFGDVVVVESLIEQAIRGTGRAPSRSTWVTTDVWAREPAGWRLVSRHPELLPSDGARG